MKRKNVVLNRPVFAQQVFDSRSLTVLTTLFHRFPEAGDYDLTIWRDERMVHRAHVRVSMEGGLYSSTWTSPRWRGSGNLTFWHQAV
jgi:hypothetical protein